jgi:Thioredoxin like C-terminal domain
LIFDVAGTARTVLYYYRPILAGGMGEVTISEDGLTPVSKYGGAHLSEEGKFIIDGQRLYNLSMHDDYGAHSIVIDVKGEGSQPYTLTFG